MCGIAGIVNLDCQTPVRADDLEKMISTMPHRGPDARGTYVPNDRLGFGHVRLAILDLRPESNQPLVFADRGFAITYNGEIYNYVELRKELETLGHRFTTNCDTEVLLAAYAQWGEDVVQKLNGMWAFAIYDHERDRVFCSRDRFGIKPFNYVRHGGRFLFASEIKAILAAEPGLARPNYDSLSILLRTSACGQLSETCFAGIMRLPPAHNLTISRGTVKIDRYWDYPNDVDDGLSFSDAADRLRELLVDATRLRLRSDVPVGVSLSSGVDSSAVACLLRTFDTRPFETFTATYGAGYHSEYPRAEALARSLEMNPNPIMAGTGDILATLEKIVYHLESPHSSPAVFPYWNIIQAARRKVTVLLEGQGADELLAGYFMICFQSAVFDLLRRGMVRRAVSEIRHARRSYAALDAMGYLGTKHFLLWIARAVAPWAHRYYRSARGDESLYIGPLKDARQSWPGRSDSPRFAERLNASLVRQHEGGLVNLLHYGDAISMAHSLEARLPFMDYRLVEFCFRLPGRLKYRDGLGKAVLRQALRSDVPADILENRAKLGFVSPVARWFRERPEQTLFPVLRSEACRTRGIFDPHQMDRLIERHCSGKANLFNVLFRCLFTELWFQRFID